MTQMKTYKKGLCNTCGAELKTVNSPDPAFFIVECGCCGEAYLLPKPK
jgi:hypothetical protein